MKTPHIHKIVTLLMILLLLPVQTVWGDKWDGTTKTTPSGAGTLADPYRIANAAEFAWFGEKMNNSTQYWVLDVDIDLDNKTWTKGGNSGSTFKGHFDGQGHTVSNVSITAVSGKNNGLFCNVQGTSATVRAEVKNLKISGVTFSETTVAAANTRVGAIAGYSKWADITNVQVSGVSFTVNGDITGAAYIAGAVGQMDAGMGEMKGVTAEDVSLAVNGTSGSTLYLSGLVGDVKGAANQLVNIFNCKVKNPTLTLTGNVTNTTYIGGAIGMTEGYTAVDGLYVEGGSITGPTTTKTITNNKEFWVGGAVAKQNSSGANLNQPNYIHNVAVSGMNIDLGKFEAAGVINNHKFGVGGVIGTVNAPNDDKNGRRGMPENLLFKGGKIYAPHAATSPTVANFGATIAHYNNYTGENITSNIDCIEKSKAGTWLYSDYQLGLSPEFLAYEKIDNWDAAPTQNRWRKNFEDTKLAAADASGVRYLSVSDETFKKQNRRLDNERPSKTVLWWTNQANYNEATGAAAALFTENEQPIYPQYNFGTVGQAELTKIPYYMYFYQGVANAKYTAESSANAIIAGIEANIAEAEKTTVVGEIPLTLTLTDNKIKYSDAPESKDVRGFDAHTLTVTPSSDVDSYKWYIEGVEQDGVTTNTFDVKPDWKTGKSVIVNAIKDGNVVASVGYALRVGVLKTKAGETEEVGSDINSRGTKTNPYIIDSPDALRQWSMLSTMNTAQIWEGLVKPTAAQNTGGVANQSQGHYNRAYYELGADIDLNNEPFIPISHVGTSGEGTDGTYTNNWIFQGNFDGKGHKISNFNVTWSAGNINGNNNQYWGLFGALGHNVLTAKWGDGTATSNTVVRNLVIDGATFTHDINNKTFYYGNGSITSTSGNRAMVGVLAGIVASNTTVENIEIRNSKITDVGSSDYDLATQGLYVGGAIGSMQYAYGTESTMPINMTVRNIVADVKITLTHPKFHDDTKPAEVGLFNVGGIIGRIIATSQATSIQAIMPSYTFFKGTVNAPKAWISPVIAAVRYNNQQAVNFANFTKQWEGNNGTEATQHSVVNAAYYKYFITVDGVDRHITESYPESECTLGSRTITRHIDGAYADPKELQGVNYNAKYISSEVAPLDEASGHILALALLNEGLAKQGVTNCKWVWSDEHDVPTLSMEAEPEHVYNYISRGTGTDLNSFRINTNSVNATYKWYKYIEGVWSVMPDVTTYSYVAVPSKSVDEFYKAEVFVNSVSVGETQTVMVKFVPMHSNFRINLNSNSGNNVYSIVNSGDEVTDQMQMNLIWFKEDGITQFMGGVDTENNTLTLNDTEKSENKKIYCLVTLKDKNTGKTLISQMVSYYNVGSVVYLMLNTDNASVNASNGMTYQFTTTDKTKDDWGRTPDNPANSWADAYSLLDEYTPAAITKGGYNNAQVKIDDSKNLVTVDDNIIVVMGLAKNNYFDNNNGVDGAVASKPATVTGKWDGVDYHGCICNTSDNISLNADHKFENIGFSISTSGRFRIYAHRWNVHMAKGILMGYEAGLAAGKDDATNYKVNYADGSTGTPVGHRAADIAVMGGYLNDGTSNNPEKNEFVNHGRKEGQIIRLESGLWGPVCPGNRQTGECVSYYIMGGPDNPAKTTFIIDIDQAWNDAHSQYKKGEFATLDVGCLLSGNHEGTMYADVVLDIRSGKMGRVVNGIKGSQRVVGQNTGFKTGGNYRHIVRNIDSNGVPVVGSGVGSIGSTTGSGTKWLYTSAPPPDSYIGRGIINISPAKAVNYTSAGSMNDRVSVVELYCGGLGRCHNDGYFHPEVATNFFGQSIVNIEGGTFYNTIYGAGAGGVNGIGTDEEGHHTDDNGIPFYPNGDNSNVWYASYDYLKETDNLGNIVPVAYHNNEPMLDRNGTVMSTDGTVDLRDTYTFINITGGVFGSETSPVSIYAGGSGETNDALINMVDAPATTDVKNAVQTPNHQAGCIFGNGEGVASEIRISNATIYGNIYGGGKGSAKYYRWICLTPTTTPDIIVNKSNYATTAFQDYTRMSQPANYATNLVAYVKNLRSKADNYLNLGQVYGDTKITLGNNAVIHGNVFGGGEGVADMTQEDFIAGTGMTLTLDNANLNISNMTGERTSKSWVLNSFADKQYISFPDMGKVFGKAQVNIEDGAIIHGNVYGGGDAGSIKGVSVDGSGNPIVAKSSEVNIKGGEIYGSVFGAGKGLTIDKAANYEDVATITGDATVNLTGGTIWQNMYGGGQNAVVNGDTYFNMSNGNIAANVYGGGMGNVDENDEDDDNPLITRANIYGNTNVNITGGKIIWDRSSLSGEQEVDVTIYNYTRNVDAVDVTAEEYESSTDDTADKVQATYTAQGYENVTATPQGPASKEVDGTTYYLWNVNYTIPAHVETVSFDYAANPEGYTPAGTSTETRKLIAGQVINWNINDPSSAYYSHFYDDIIGKFNIEHNIFGGGYLACNVGQYYKAGDSEVTAGTKQVGDLVEGTGSAKVIMTKGLFGNDLISTRQWKESYNRHEHPHFYVFGGGYGIFTQVGKSDVYVALPIDENEGGSMDTDDQLAPPRKTSPDTEEIDVNIVSSSYGMPYSTILGILGGGYNGHVGETNVLVGDATYTHRVYGGGLGSYEGWVEAGQPATPEAAASAVGKLGTTGPTSVVIAGGHIYGDVFGGGAGVAPRKLEGDTYTDFTQIARTVGNTSVKLRSFRDYKYELYYDSLYVKAQDGSKPAPVGEPDSYLTDNQKKQKPEVYGTVYGGGDVANVTGNTHIGFAGGNIFGYMIGAGLGRYKAEAANYQDIGRVEGSTNIEMHDYIRFLRWDGTDKTDSLEVQNNQTLGINFKPHAWNDIYGGGRNGITTGNTRVNIFGGYVGNNIFGGGWGRTNDNDDDTDDTYADILGNTEVNVHGGNYLWKQMSNVNGDIKKYDDVIENKIALAAVMKYAAGPDDPANPYADPAYLQAAQAMLGVKTQTDGLFDLTEKLFKSPIDPENPYYDHNIYGGGNKACNVGTYDGSNLQSGGEASVNIYHGMLADSLGYADSQNWKIGALLRYLILDNYQHPQFAVLGGGYGAQTKVGTTNVNIQIGMHNAMGDDANYASYAKDTKTWADFYSGLQGEFAQLQKDNPDAIKELYGGSSGANGFARYLISRMCWTFGVPHHTVLYVAGGGLAGKVVGNTQVDLGHHSGALGIYGGGIGLEPATVADQSAAEKYRYGEVGRNATVNVTGGVISRSIYGGGAGIESKKIEGDAKVDFVNMARVHGTTSVSIDGYSTGTLVYGKIYGGGDVANVGEHSTVVESNQQTDVSFSDPQSTVTITGGNIFQEVFAGGKGRTVSECSNYRNLGAINGNARLNIQNVTYTAEKATLENEAQSGFLTADSGGKKPGDDGYSPTYSNGYTPVSAGDVSMPWLWNRLYGGCENGTVYGNTEVNIAGGNLGHNIFGGGWGNVEERDGDEPLITSADVKQNTNVNIMGGLFTLSQMWNSESRSWVKVNEYTDENGKSSIYSSQYNPETNKFVIDHNIYGGGNIASVIAGNSWVNMTRGLLQATTQLGHDYSGQFFEQEEWKNVYNRHASPHFCLFGGGYGPDAKITNNANVTVNIPDRIDDTDAIKPSDGFDLENLSANFHNNQSLMDVVGGGFEGPVDGTCNVTIDGNTFMRNVFGGAYYAAVGNTNVAIKQSNMDNVFGGGMMGNVTDNVTVTVGQAHDGAHNDAISAANKEIVILANVFGANDVAGVVGATENDGEITPNSAETAGVRMHLNGGHIYGNVYGGGNGDYLYMIKQDIDKVEVIDDYELDADNKRTVFAVPSRMNTFPAVAAMSQAQKIVNISSYRPVVTKVDIDVKGNSTSDRLIIGKGLFGGGNSATVSKIEDNEAYVKLNIGSHIDVGSVFLGSDGDALFETSTNFENYFSQINGIVLQSPIDWDSPENRDIPRKYLTEVDNRKTVYRNLIDLYFMPVEMNMMPEVTWGTGHKNNSVKVAAGTVTYTDIPETPGTPENYLTDATIGTFCCGGNRGNMNTGTNFHVNFPKGLTITGNVIGGCNNANYDYRVPGTYNPETDTWQIVEHVGGFLVGKHGVGADHTPQIHLTLRNKFKTQKVDNLYPEGINVFGGCYSSGNVIGDILVDVRSNMLMSDVDGSGNIVGLDSLALRNSTENVEPNRTVASIYGAGYGKKTWVYGDTEVRLGTSDELSRSNWTAAATRYNTTGASCNYIFGGGRQGNVIGNTNVHVLNGRVAGCVVGASYSGELYGNAQTIVGYPEKYYRANESGRFALTRADMDETHATFVDDKEKPLIRQSVYYTKGDLVTAAVYDEIDAGERSKFALEHSTPDNNAWNNINIQIDKAIYGGGYALAFSSSGVSSGSYTVKKYTDDYRFDDNTISTTYGITEGDGVSFNHYGGNTFVMVGDVTGDYDTQAETTTPVANEEKSKDHVTISSRQLEPVSPKTGDDLFGLYYQQTKKEAEEAPEDDPTANDPTGPFLCVSYQAQKEPSDPHRYYRFTGEGGLYGDGHLSLSEGFRVADVMGYGYGANRPTNPKLMNCVHRFDIARFKDGCITLLGDRDYASTEGSSANSASYSLAHVGELRMESSINITEDYLAKNESKSRNYIGLSNIVIDLGAVWSNDAFGDALYHDKTGKVGLINDEVSEIGGKITSPITYKKVKEWFIGMNEAAVTASDYYDNVNAQVMNEQRFQLRNSATARNMIGIASGIALVVQGTRTEIVEGTPTQQSYYGPVCGVFEADLVNVRAGEAGGYVYAQNIHSEKVGGTGDKKDKATFLETSGNFVFPSNETRKVIDNCFPGMFTDEHRDASEGHYWYVSGFKYYYNATLTGYTYDGISRVFDMENNSHLIFMPGTKAGATITLKSFHFLDRHATGKQAACDIEHKLLTSTGDVSSWATTMPAENAILTNGGLQNTDAAKYYNLSVCVSDGSTDTYGHSVTISSVESPLPYIDYLKVDATERRKDAHDVEYDTFVNQNLSMTNTAVCDNPLIAVRLTDIVNNNGKVDDETTYFDRHLSDPCVAFLCLTAPALDNSGKPLYDSYTRIQNESEITPTGKEYYTQDVNGDYQWMSYENALTTFRSDIPVYYPQTENLYLPVGDGDFDPSRSYFTLKSGHESDNPITAESVDSWSGTKDQFNTQRGSLYYLRPAATEQTYEYNLTLTINYIQGPSYEGSPTIYNCALPGEMIRMSSETVKVTSDQMSLPQNGSFWTFGPGQKVWNDPDDHSKGYHWQLVDLTGTKTVYAKQTEGVWDFKEEAESGYTEYKRLDSKSRNLYYPYNPNVTFAGDQKASSILSRDVVFENSDNQDFYIPAYYFMDGYVAQYSFTVKGLDDVFNVMIIPEDTLVVHNYHSASHANYNNGTTGEVRIRDAAQSGKHPRVYIETLADLNEFVSYVNRTDDVVETGMVLLPGTDYGAGTDFHLMANITVPNDWTTPVNFKGTFHGNGYSISGLPADGYLFEAMDNAANVYNLGLPTGVITKNDGQAENTKYHCCYTKQNNTVYRMDGTVRTNYTDDDWRFGRVTYDLNQYYLERRISNAILVTDEDEVLANKRMAETVTFPFNEYTYSGVYVEDIYRNGDYRYARTQTADAETYLRTRPEPKYAHGYAKDIIDAITSDASQDNAITHHKFTFYNGEINHNVDESRAYYNNDGTEMQEYRPLFEQSKHNSSADLSIVKNDYLYFGQYVYPESNPQSQQIPASLVNTQRNVETMWNRVYRAYGYYSSKEHGLYHSNTNAYVIAPHEPMLTAIDFTGNHDRDLAWVQGYGADDEAKAFFYPPVIDLPNRLQSFNVSDEVTRNLLVYTDNGTETDRTYSTVYASNNLAFQYNEETQERYLRGHQILLDPSSSTYSTDYLHLVERQPGDATFSNDFNCPIEFTVNNRAWYTRKPLAYSFGNSAWEGICLPFLVNKVEAADNGEITHFYNDGVEYAADAINKGKTGHEYWLRTLNKVENVDAETRATFLAPSAGALGNYTYSNNFYATTYGDDYKHNAYSGALTYDNYAFQQANTPYIVSFPGKKYYEFDLSNEFYNSWFSANWEPQSITFNHYAIQDGVSGAAAKGVATVAVTDEVRSAVETPMVHTAGGYRHVGVYKHLLVNEDDGYLAIGNTNKIGDSFISETIMDADNPSATTREIAPFRTYMTSKAPAYAAKRVIISEETTGVIEIPYESEFGEEHKSTEDEMQQGMSFTIDRLCVTFNSTYDATVPIRVYNAAGQLILVHDVVNGTSKFLLPCDGIYIIGGKKVFAKW